MRRKSLGPLGVHTFSPETWGTAKQQRGKAALIPWWGDGVKQTPSSVKKPTPGAGCCKAAPRPSPAPTGGSLGTPCKFSLQALSLSP